MQPTPLEQAVLRTVTWFSVFSYPVTEFEVWKWLLQPDRLYELSEVYRILDESIWLSERLERQDGFVTLLTNAPLSVQIQERQERFLDAVTKFASLRRAATWFQLLPGVRAVAAVNTLAWWHTTQQSDIDLYIITKPGMIWSSRLLLVAPFKLLGRRPHTSDQVHNPFCFSFFNTTDHLDLEQLQIDRDYYLAFWSKSLVPIFDKDALFEQHYQENRWVNTLLPCARERSLHHHHRPRMLASLPIQFKAMESFTKSFQKRKFPSDIRTLANKDTRVVINDHMLKLYPTDRRELFRDAYERELNRHV